MEASEFYGLFLKSKNAVIDSRKVSPGDIFFAFSGVNFNAAEQAAQAIDSGALAVVVEQEEYADPEKNIFCVPSTLNFLQDLAKFHRAQLKIPIIGLTGSNGKTTTKELISAVLAEKFRVQYTQGNLNNHIGVPLTLLSIRSQHEIGVVEMGANHQKEIAQLCEIARPDIGYITNFGKAHLEGFGGFEGVIKGKSELYDYLKASEKIILVNDNDALQVEKTLGYERILSFGKPDSDYYFEQFADGHFVGLTYLIDHAKSKLTGDYNFSNLCAAAALGLNFEIDFEQIRYAIENYEPTNMRSQIVEKSGKTVVLDTYNANPSSMAAALQNFKKFEGSKSVIIGDMLELGAESDAEHRAILRLAADFGFNEIYTVGNLFKNAGAANAFETSEELAEYLKSSKINSENILIKGSRGIALEKIVDFI